MPVATRSLSCWPFHQVKNAGALLPAIEVCMNAWYLSVGVISCSLIVAPEAALADAERALNHPVAFSITNDFPLVSAALDQGVLLDAIKPKNRISRDIGEILDACQALILQEAD